MTTILKSSQCLYLSWSWHFCQLNSTSHTSRLVISFLIANHNLAMPLEKVSSVWITLENWHLNSCHSMESSLLIFMRPFLQSFLSKSHQIFASIYFTIPLIRKKFFSASLNLQLKTFLESSEPKLLHLFLSAKLLSFRIFPPIQASSIDNRYDELRTQTIQRKANLFEGGGPKKEKILMGIFTIMIAVWRWCMFLVLFFIYFAREIPAPHELSLPSTLFCQGSAPGPL